MRQPTYRYTIYIAASAEQAWQALTDPDVSARYWGHSNVSDWQVGSTWDHVRTDGSGAIDVTGVVLECEPGSHLVMTFGPPGAESTRVTLNIEPYGPIVRLTVTHEDLPSDTDAKAAAHGWPAVLSNLKTLLETGAPLPEVPWEMPAG